MPCAAVHLHLSGALLDAWRRSPAEAPIDPESPSEVDAFLHGSMAPDMGFVPGVDRFISELAHYVQPGDLAKGLLARARTDVERAFAWGWSAHLEGDVALHPRVGQAVGERLHGDRGLRVNAIENEEVHVGLEVGLDIRVLTGRPVPSSPRAPFTREELSFLSEALEGVYRLPWDAGRLSREHSLAVRVLAAWPRVLAFLARGRGLNGTRTSLLGDLISATGRLGRERSAVRGFFRPLSPPDWLLAEVDRAARELPARMLALARSGGADMENRNLETGLQEDECRDHPGAVRARSRLFTLLDRATLQAEGA